MAKDVSYEPVQGGDPRNKCCCCCKCCCISIAVIGVGILCVVLGFFLYLFITLGHVPFHASCQVTWTVDAGCEDVNNALVGQIKDWGMNDTLCGTEQKCLYQLSTNNGSYLTGTHTTPLKRYIDDISYTFLDQGQDDCQIMGYSTSQVWYAILDKGTNYCNIHNLIYGPNVGALNATIEEKTSDSICTQYSSSDCEKY